MPERTPAPTGAPETEARLRGQVERILAGVVEDYTTAPEALERIVAVTAEEVRAAYRACAALGWRTPEDAARLRAVESARDDYERLIVDADDTALRRGERYGLCDCIGNDGDPAERAVLRDARGEEADDGG